MAKYRSTYPTKVTRSRKASYYRKQYGLELLDLERLYVAQSGRCYLCNHALRIPALHIAPNFQGARTASVDHMHALAEGKMSPAEKRALVRGLLCKFPCNYVLQKYWTPERLRRAAEYLEHPPAKRVL